MPDLSNARAPASQSAVGLLIRSIGDHSNPKAAAVITESGIGAKRAADAAAGIAPATRSVNNPYEQHGNPTNRTLAVPHISTDEVQAFIAAAAHHGFALDATLVANASA